MDVENPLPPPPSLPQSPRPRLPQLNLRKERCKALYHAAINGDWKTAEGILRDTPNYGRDSITARKDTVLHVAALGGNTLFVRKVVEMLKSGEDLEVKNDYGCTAFYNAVLSGVVENAKCMIEKNERLPSIRSYGEITPIHQAALQRHKEMVSYLHTVTPFKELKRPELIKLIKITIYNQMHDVALKILKEDRSLALAKFKGNRSFLHMLVRKQRIAPTGGDKHVKQEAGILQRFLGSTSATASTRLLQKGIEEECLANPQAGELLDIIWEEHLKLADYKFREVITREYEILHYAAKEGNVEFLDKILESKPDLFCERNKSGQTILHVAVLYRQQNVVSYICNKQGYKDIMTLLVDDNGNNILHLAAKAGNTLLCKSQDEADDHQWIDEEEMEEVPKQKKKVIHYEKKSKQELLAVLLSKIAQKEVVPENKKKDDQDEKNIMQESSALKTSTVAQKEVVPENKKKDDQEEEKNIMQESSALKTSTVAQKEVVPENKKKDDQEDVKNIMQESSALKISTVAQKEVVPENKKKDYQEDEKNIMQESSALGLSTAALHYEREISWFMGVEKIVPSSFHHMRNKDGKTPKQLFLKEHMKLKMNAEKSIRGTADSCMIVATLIATVAFSAAFTAPGGNDGQTGIPIFIYKTSKLYSFHNIRCCGNDLLDGVNSHILIHPHLAQYG